MAIPAAEPERPLDDVMIAMDIVDVLRHDERLVERELNDEKRRVELIERLHNLYKGQGIEVPNEILEEGVKALEEKRFVYTPAPKTLSFRLAKLYVARKTWSRWMAIGLVALIVAFSGWYLAYERPRAQQEAALQRELAEELPKTISTLLGQIGGEAQSARAKTKAERIAQSGLSAASGGQVIAARDAATRLTSMLEELRREFDVRIVNRRGEVSGLWRVPRVNPDQRNYYLVVEAIDRSGDSIEREILNEETGRRMHVKKWAVRVPKATFEKFQADKLDDGIIQMAVIGEKEPGHLKPAWRIPLPGGALTEW
jgi:hypothetical protein